MSSLVYAVLAGYNSAPGVASINSSSGVQRVVGRIDLAGASVSTGTIISDAFVGSSVRSAASVDGTAYWVGGASSSGLDAGIRYVVHGSSGASSDLFSSIQNMRATEIINGVDDAVWNPATDPLIPMKYTVANWPDSPKRRRQP